MNACTERMLARCIAFCSVLMLLAALALASQALLAHPEPAELPALDLAAIIDTPATAAPVDASVKRLAQTQMTRGRPAAPKAAAPTQAPLATLLRIKGIMDFGDPGSNEVLIEVVQSGQTKSYKVGEQVEATGATVLEIGDSVVFDYAGGKVKLNVADPEQAERGPIANPMNNANLAGGQRR